MEAIVQLVSATIISRSEKGRQRRGKVETFLNPEKKFQRPIGFAAGRERNVLELAGRIGDLVESAC